MKFPFVDRNHRKEELEEEIRSHFQMSLEDRVARGEDAATAASAARRELGNVGLIQDVTNQMWGWVWLENLLQDLRHGSRLLRKDPAFATIAILTLGLGIGASTSIFSVIYGVLLQPLPYPKPEQIFVLFETSARGGTMNFTDPNFDDLHAQNHSLQGMAEYATDEEAVIGGTETKRIGVAAVSKDFFPILQIHPILGRGWLPEDQHFGAAQVALVSYDYWIQDLGGSTDLASKKLGIDKQEVSVAGVLPPGFHFPDNTKIWLPRELEEPTPSRTAHNWQVVARLGDGVSAVQARTELSAIAKNLKQTYGGLTDMADISLSPMREAMTEDVRKNLLILLGAVGVLLLIACGNVANLLLAQAVKREGELGIRAALGARHSRLVRQFLAEALLLAAGGGLLGIAISLWGVRSLLALAPSGLPRIDEISVNLPVLLFTLGLTAAVAIGLGISTALRVTSANLQRKLADVSIARSSHSQANLLNRFISAIQVAMTLTLLVGAGLLGRSLLKVLSVDPGFRTENVMTVNLVLPSIDQDTGAVHRTAFLNNLFARLHAIPGVTDAGGISNLPLANPPSFGTYLVMDSAREAPRKDELESLFHRNLPHGVANYCAASEGYFSTLGIPLLQGRLFQDSDTADAPHVAVISRSLARTQWPNQNPLGHKIEFGNMDSDTHFLTVVGVVKDVRGRNLETPPSPTIYVNYRQRPRRTQTLTAVLRSSLDPGSLHASVRQILHDLDPTIPIVPSTFAEVVTSSVRDRRFNATILSVFAGAALLLAMIGIYGVLAHSVAQRTREIGIRMALGASAQNVVRLILRQGLTTIIAGVVLGVVCSLLVTRTMRSMLYGVSATDPLTFAMVVVLLFIVALVACYFAARKASMVDPIVALRQE